MSTAPGTPQRPKPTAIGRTVDAATEFFAHCALLCCLLVGMKGIELFASKLWGRGRIFHFGSQDIPMQLFFDGADAGLITAILLIGTYATLKRYGGR